VYSDTHCQERYCNDPYGKLVIRNADTLPISDRLIRPAIATAAEIIPGNIRHLIKANVILGLRLMTIHNLHFLMNLMAEIRQAIIEDKLPE
jgi:queuine tRNA-ribosyltransferase